MNFYSTEGKLLLAKFRNSKVYESFDESPFAEFVKNSEHSDLIDGNCIVMKRDIPMFGISYIGYFVDAVGHISAIKESMKHDSSMESAVTWMSSEDFWVNKEEYISRCDTPMYATQFVPEREYWQAKEFNEKFPKWLESQPGSVRAKMTGTDYSPI